MRYTLLQLLTVLIDRLLDLLQMFRDNNWLEERFRFPSGGDRRSITPVFRGGTDRQYESCTQYVFGPVASKRHRALRVLTTPTTILLNGGLFWASTLVQGIVPKEGRRGRRANLDNTGPSQNLATEIPARASAPTEGVLLTS